MLFETVRAPRMAGRVFGWLAAFRQAADRALNLLVDEPAHVRRRLEGMPDACAFVERKFPNLIERLAREPIGRDDGREMRDD